MVGHIGFGATLMTLDPALSQFVRAAGLADGDEVGVWSPLSGGVSSDIWHVSLRSGDYCVKRALSQLKVAATWTAPVERNAFEWDYMVEADRIVPGQVPQPIARDAGLGLFAMAWLAPDRYALWKTELLAGRVNVASSSAVGALIGKIHAATAGRTDVAERFATDEIFHALRIEPYLLATASAHPGLSDYIVATATTMANTRRALVHGDVSPKNILIGNEGPVLLDAECAWFGDPAFDLAFCLNHLLIKACILPRARVVLAESFDAFAAAALAQVNWEAPGDVARRTATLLPILALARVDGKSPLEYLDDVQRAMVRDRATACIKNAPTELAAVKAMMLVD